jgi:DNA/RNA-binding domain of Phe-tRNA-synthetase-like protein
MLRYDISDIIAEYADIHIGVIVCRGLNNRSSHPQLAQLQQNALKVAKLKIGDQPLTQHPYIASWRQIYKRFGTKPGDYRPSAENLLRRALKTGQLYRINTAVDIYNIVSVKYLLPMGGFDIDHVDGTIRLRKSDGGESFHPLGTKGPEETYLGEIVYADDSRVLTRRWNYRDAVETQITEDTVNVVMFFDASAEIPINVVTDAMEEFMTRLRESCGGNIVHAIASKDQPVIDL